MSTTSSLLIEVGLIGLITGLIVGFPVGSILRIIPPVEIITADLATEIIESKVMSVRFISSFSV